ncbi:hypothetical protein PPERSA_05450 [Pseudocohnilembus persalinus]|uniref:E3 UFM1-protein ligase 1-like N-terminal domain-containing protein n=1 Tax=Pseudocohnilembus persalinus TaxID=266149 RepID=A0A0V0R818_PSEPJ|nr:hypothetical protein PPERSA_05450 [Pseudocohnilembus persalinus]|eukprot:KRX10630.1 hypothetical protein PPERSA_05450 [Pseudocohnilembus persalinus]
MEYNKNFKIQLDQKIKFLDQIAEEINEQLQQNAQISLSEISLKFEFPLQFTKKFIEERLNTIIQGKILGGDKLTTISFQDIMRAKVKGSLRATTKPQSVNSLVHDYKIEPSIINRIIEELIEKQEIDGKLQAGMFIPARFTKNQENIVKNFFRQNNFVEYDLLQKQLFIQRPKEFLKQSFKDKCIFLENCAYSVDNIKALHENIEEILNEEGFTDIQMHFPSNLTDQDIDALLFKHMKLQDVELVKTQIEIYLFSQEFIQRAAASFKEPIIQLIYNAPQKLLEKQNQSQQEIEQASAGGKKKGKKGPASKNKQGKKQQQNNANFLFSNDEALQHLVQQKIIQQDDRDENFDESFCKVLQPEIVKFYDNIKVELFQNKKQASNEFIEDLTNKITDLLLSLQYVQKSCNYIEMNFSTIDINLFLERGLFAERMLIEQLVVFFCKKYGVQLNPNLLAESEPKQQPQQQQIENELQTQSSQTQNKKLPNYIDCGNIKVNKSFKGKAELVAGIESIPKDYNQLLKQCMEMYLQKKFEPLLQQVLQNQDLIGVKANLDKRSEKNFTYFIKYTAKESLKKQKEDKLLAVENFHKILTLYLLDKKNIFFIGNVEDEKFLYLLINVLFEISQESNIKDIAQNAQNIIQEIKQKNSNTEDLLNKLHQINQEFITHQNQILGVNYNSKNLKNDQIKSEKTQNIEQSQNSQINIEWTLNLNQVFNTQEQIQQQQQQQFQQNNFQPTIIANYENKIYVLEGTSLSIINTAKYQNQNQNFDQNQDYKVIDLNFTPRNQEENIFEKKIPVFQEDGEFLEDANDIFLQDGEYFQLFYQFNYEFSYHQQNNLLLFFTNWEILVLDLKNDHLKKIEILKQNVTDTKLEMLSISDNEKKEFKKDLKNKEQNNSYSLILLQSQANQICVSELQLNENKKKQTLNQQNIQKQIQCIELDYYFFDAQSYITKNGFILINEFDIIFVFLQEKNQTKIIKFRTQIYDDTDDNQQDGEQNSNFNNNINNNYQKINTDFINIEQIITFSNSELFILINQQKIAYIYKFSENQQKNINIQKLKELKNFPLFDFFSFVPLKNKNESIFLLTVMDQSNIFAQIYHSDIDEVGTIGRYISESKIQTDNIFYDFDEQKQKVNLIAQTNKGQTINVIELFNRGGKVISTAQILSDEIIASLFVNLENQEHKILKNRNHPHQIQKQNKKQQNNQFQIDYCQNYIENTYLIQQNIFTQNIKEFIQQPKNYFNIFEISELISNSKFILQSYLKRIRSNLQEIAVNSINIAQKTFDIFFEIRDKYVKLKKIEEIKKNIMNIYDQISQKTEKITQKSEEINFKNELVFYQKNGNLNLLNTSNGQIKARLNVYDTIYQQKYPENISDILIFKSLFSLNDNKIIAFEFQNPNKENSKYQDSLIFYKIEKDTLQFSVLDYFDLDEKVSFLQKIPKTANNYWESLLITYNNKNYFSIYPEIPITNFDVQIYQYDENKLILHSFNLENPINTDKFNQNQQNQKEEPQQKNQLKKYKIVEKIVLELYQNYQIIDILLQNYNNDKINYINPNNYSPYINQDMIIILAKNEQNQEYQIIFYSKKNQSIIQNFTFKEQFDLNKTIKAEYFKNKLLIYYFDLKEQLFKIKTFTISLNLKNLFSYYDLFNEQLSKYLGPNLINDDSFFIFYFKKAFQIVGIDLADSIFQLQQYFNINQKPSYIKKIEKIISNSNILQENLDIQIDDYQIPQTLKNLQKFEILNKNNTSHNTQENNLLLINQENSIFLLNFNLFENENNRNNNKQLNGG